jgi:hypothetical protein
METPEKDVSKRRIIWNAMQMLYMDTDPQQELEAIARVCAESNYSIEELEQILFNEVLPACRVNLLLFTAPEWTGYNEDWLQQRILAKHRFGKRKPFILRRYTSHWWQQLGQKIAVLRNQD